MWIIKKQGINKVSIWNNKTGRQQKRGDKAQGNKKKKESQTNQTLGKQEETQRGDPFTSKKKKKKKKNTGKHRFAQKKGDTQSVTQNMTHKVIIYEIKQETAKTKPKPKWRYDLWGLVVY